MKSEERSRSNRIARVVTVGALIGVLISVNITLMHMVFGVPHRNSEAAGTTVASFFTSLLIDIPIGIVTVIIVAALLSRRGEPQRPTDANT